MRNRKKLFDKNYPIIHEEVYKREYLWKLHGLPYLSYDDFAQELFIRVYDKLHLYNPEHDFTVWVRVVIRNFWNNWLRNHLKQISPPCSHCPLAFNENGCFYTASQERDSTCFFFDKWVRSKKVNAYYIGLPVPISNHENETNAKPCESFNYEHVKKELEEILKKRLTVTEWKIYTLLYIKNWSEEQVEKKMKFKNDKYNNENRMLYNYKKKILEVAKQIIKNEL